MSRSTNVRATVKVGEPTGARTLRQARIADAAALEALPEAVRAALNELTINLSAASVLAYYRDVERQACQFGGSPYDAEVWTLRKLAAIEAGDLDAFAEQYQRGYKAPLPHVGAQATVLRYGPQGRRGRLRLQEVVKRKAAELCARLEVPETLHEPDARPLRATVPAAVRAAVSAARR